MSKGDELLQFPWSPILAILLPFKESLSDALMMAMISSSVFLNHPSVIYHMQMFRH